jgi:thiol-disulfide isomerase/thioredoxin
MPDFSLPLAGGGTFRLSENLGKPVLINLFATWCPSCVGGMPVIDQLFKELSDQVNFLVIDIGEDEQTALDFAEQNEYSLPFAYSEDGMPFGRGYLVYSIPRTFVLDADGVISAYYEGMQDYDTFKAAIQAALAH